MGAYFHRQTYNIFLQFFIFFLFQQNDNVGQIWTPENGGSTRMCWMWKEDSRQVNTGSAVVAKSLEHCDTSYNFLRAVIVAVSN